MRRLLTSAITMGIGIAIAAAAAAVTVSATIDRAEVYVGEPIRYTVHVTAPRALDVTLDPIGPTWGAFAVDERGVTPSYDTEGMTHDEYWFALRSFAVGEQTIPPPEVTVHGAMGEETTAQGQSLRVIVNSLLPAAWETEDIRDLKPPIAVQRGSWWPWVMGGMVLVIGGAWWWLRRPRAPVVGPTPRPADVVALDALQALQREQLPAQQRFEEYYVRLSQIARRYIEGRFGLRAPEMTTEEFLRTAAQATQLSQQQQQALQQFLAHCDLVKFARYHPTAHEADESFAATQRFVEETRLRGEGW